MPGVDSDLLRADLAAYYPQFGLRVAHAGLELAPPTDVELFELAAIVAEPGGIVGPGQEHFLTWPTGTADAADGFLRHHWGRRTRPGPEEWLAPFAVIAEGRAVGVATVHASRWAGTRDVDTGSWLARAEQGRGLGRRARLMLLDLAFGHLDATRALTAAAEDNAASLRVSARCGYRELRRSVAPDGVREVRLAITPAAWRRRRLSDVVVDGAEAFRAAIGG